MRFFQKAVAGPVKPSKNTPSAICPLDPLAEDERGHPNPGHAALHQNQSWKRPLLKVNPSFFWSSLKVFLCTFACRITAVVNVPLKHFQAQVLKECLEHIGKRQQVVPDVFTTTNPGHRKQAQLATKQVYWDLIQSQWLIEDYLSLSFSLQDAKYNI